MTTFATADEIALAVVTACRLTGDEPELCARGAHGIRARWFAFAEVVGALVAGQYGEQAL